MCFIRVFLSCCNPLSYAVMIQVKRDVNVSMFTAVHVNVQ